MRYDYFQDERLEYEDIEIPDELLLMVRRTVTADRRRKAAMRRSRIIKAAGSIAAILFLCLTIGVNTSYAFAETAVKIPVVKSVAKAVIVRSYREDIIALDKQENKLPEEEPDTQEPSGEMAPAISDNDVILEEETPEQQAAQEPVEEPEGLDAWKADMTLEKFRAVTELYTLEMEERYADAPENLRTILLAELPEKDISLYGYHEDGMLTGAALRVNDTYQYFDWNYMNDSKKLPEITVSDLDEDGTEEVVVLLYNGAPQKTEISKEDIPAPGEQAEEKDPDTEITDSPDSASDTVKSDPGISGTTKPEEKNAAGTSDPVKPEEKNTSTPDPAKIQAPAEEGNNRSKTPADENINRTKTSAQEEVSGDNIQKEAPADDTQEPSVSGNDIAAFEKPENEPKQQAGELWVISLEEENWQAAVLSVDDYESQILRRLKAEYDETAGIIQLYIMEEPFGDPITLETENPENLTYESINLAPEREFIIEKGLSLRFRLEAAFETGAPQKITLPLNPGLEAEIHLEEGSLVIDKINF